MAARNGELILAVDLGTSGCKCALIGPEGTVHSWASRPVPLHIVDETGAEQDPEDWWNAFVESAREVLTAVPQSIGRISAICCSSQGECTLPVDEAGKPL